MRNHGWVPRSRRQATLSALLIAISQVTFPRLAEVTTAVQFFNVNYILVAEKVAASKYHRVSL